MAERSDGARPHNICGLEHHRSDADLASIRVAAGKHARREVSQGRRCGVSVCYAEFVPGPDVNLSYDEAMAVCLLLAEAADASADDEPLRDTWAAEARLMIELILGRTDR